MGGPQVIFNLFRFGMVLKVIVIDHLVDKPYVARPVVFRQRLGKADVEFEVGVVLFDLLELIGVKQFTEGAPAIPESSFTLGVFCIKQVEDVRPHGCHAGSTADEHHLPLCRLDEELTVRPGNGYLVTGFT